MLQRWKRVLAAVLTAVMLAGALPTGAYASFGQLIDNGAVKNAALAEALEKAFGADAETYYAILEEYGLLDEEGNLVTNEKVVVDGVAYTLEELEDYLARPGVDLGKRAEVDGEYYTLEELQKVLEIERELARIQALYFTPQELTDEHIKSFQNLAGAVANGGLRLMAADGAGLGPAGVDHSVRLEVTTDANATLGNPYTVTVTPKKAQSQPITFFWRAVGSSAAGSGNGTIPANSTAPVTLKVDVKPIDEELNGKDSFVVQIYNVKNALFSDGSTRWEKQVTVEKKDPYSNYNTTFDKEFPDFTLTNDSNLIYAYMPTFGNSSGPKGNAALWEGDPFKNAENNYVVERNTQVTVAGLPKGEYEVKAEVHLPFSTFDGEFNSNDTSTEEGQIKRLFEDLPTEYAKGTPISGKDKPAQYRVTISGDYKKEWKGSTGLFNDQKTGYYQHNTITETTDPFYRTVTGSDDKFVYSAKLEETAGVHEFIVLDGSGTTQWPEHARFYGPHEFTYAYLRITVQERTTETTATISAPPGIYYAGQSIPIRVKFDFPMNIGKSNNLTLTVNGEKLEPLHDWVYGEVCTFLYKVTDKSGGKLNLTDFSLNGVGVNGRDITVKLSDASVKKGEDFSGITMEALDRDRAFAGYQTEVKNDAATNQPILTVTVPLDSSKDLTAWVLREVSNGVLNPFQAGTSMTEGKRYPFKVNNTQNPTALFAEIPLPYNSTSGTLTGLVDLWLDGSVLMGKNLTFTVEPSTPVGKFDMNPVLTITPAGGTGEEYVPGRNPDLIYAQQDNTLELDFTLDAKSPPYTWGKLDKVTYYDKDNKLFPLSGGAAPHFAWKSDNTEVAQLVVKDGEHKAVIIPTGKAGTVNFTLTAFNGGPDVDGTVVGMADATAPAITVQFAVGSDPFLNIPAGGRALAIREEQDAVVSWSSNICQKNQEASTELDFVETSFQVDVTYIPEGSKEEKTLTLPQAVTDQLTTSPANPSISSVTIPWMVCEETGDGEGEWVPVLKQAYDEKARSVTVVVSTTYGGKTYGGVDATATIKMTSLPAQVTLAEPEGGLYQIDSKDGRELTLTWSMPHLDETTGGQFELYIASDALETPIVRNLENRDGVTEEGGIWSYTLKAPQVDLKTDPTDPGRYRDSYTVTVKAKNTAETIWASDSYVVYVYAEDALKIMLDGKYLGTKHIMSNVEDIKTMWEKDPTGQTIVDLQRNIALKNMISANHGEFAWAELADMIAWNSSDSTVATVNYQQGTLYENIENFPSAAYRPTDDFILSGLKSGETQVTATHIETEQTKTLDVTVATLRDQLYLFQCYPKQETVLTYSVYTNAARTAISTPRTQKTNTNGEAAIYTEYGIAGDVYCKSVTDAEGDEESVTYLGTIYNRSLVSSEADSTKLQLYPVNTIQLRRAAQAVIYLKNPDGTPYQGNVTFRGGVYRDGVYCTGSGEETGVIFGLQTTPQEEWKPGYEPQTKGVEKDGSLTVTMDVTQFMYEGKTDKVEAGDRLYYLFQLDYGDGKQASHYPLLVRMDATMNAKDVAATGDSIVFWEENETGAAHPFIIAQNLRYSASPGASVADVRKSTGNVGPSTTFPDAWLTTTVMWWGDEAEETADGESGTEVEDGTEKPAYSVTLRDTTGKVPGGQTGEVKDYPFTNQTYTENVLKMDRQVMDTWGVGKGERRSLQAMLSKDGTTANATVPLPFKVINMIGVQEAENAGVLGETQNEIKDGLNADMGNLSGIDGMVQSGLKNLAGESKYDSSKDKVSVRLCATSDPTIFRAFFSLSVGNMGSDDNVTGVYPDYTKTDEMSFAQVDSAAKQGDADYFPNPLDVARMATGTYGKAVAADATKAAKGQAVRGWSGDVGGYYEADIAYNAETGIWECRPVSGGFHLGGGVNFSWFFNAFVGPVPVTLSLTLGATMELSMDMQRGNYWTIPGGADQITGMNNYAGMSSSGIEEEAKKLNATEAYGKDYLTKLRIFLYVRAFAGVGFDLSVVAFKIGVFGQLNVDLTLGWLNREYLKDPNRLSAVGAPETRKKTVMNGQQLIFSGSTGVEFLFKFLFISYEHVFCSVGFQLGDTTNEWKEIQDIWAANQTINNGPILRRIMPNGQEMYAINLGPRLESRNYVDAVPQEWVEDRPMRLLRALDGENDQGSLLATGFQSGAYPYANPVLSDDGAVMLYLSDRVAGNYESAKDITNTRVAWSNKSPSGQFGSGTRFDEGNWGVPVGYGDSGVKVAGKANNGKSGGYAAAWVRQMENIVPEDVANGGLLDAGQQMIQMNSTEIMAATSPDGKTWSLKRLTENGTPDLAPVVATNGGRTVVAWREVNASKVDAITNFDQQDAIRYAVYEGGKWSDTQTLYDGTGTDASVKGIEAAMLTDGTAAVVYTLDTGDREDNTDWETVVALIPDAPETQTRAGDTSEEVKSEDTVRTFRLTKNSDLDENPQITTVTFGTGDDAVERFVIAWHTERAIQAANEEGKLVNTGETQSDIRLAAMDRSGVLYENMPESLGRATEGTGETVGSNFRLVKNAGSMDDLSILWVDSVSGGADEEDYSKGNAAGAFAAAYQNNVGYDVLKAVKFVKGGNSYTVSGTVEVAKMESGTLIDHFDAYVNEEKKVKSVILGTNYPTPTPEITPETHPEKFEKREVMISDGGEGTPATITLPIPVTGMYSATAEFTNRIEMPAVMLEYDKLFPDSDIDVQFTVRNSGKAPVTGLMIVPVVDGAAVMEEDQAYYTSAKDPVYGEGGKTLNLLPNRDLTVTAKVPVGPEVENKDYAIIATFTEGSKKQQVELKGTLNLDIPDVGISKVTVVREGNGLRTLRYSLYNALSAKLADREDEWRVKVGFYADRDYTEPLKGIVGADIEDGTKVPLEMTISDPEKLALIDAGGYSDQVTLSVLDFENMTDDDGSPREIPAAGIPVYVKAWIEAPEKEPEQQGYSLLRVSPEKQYNPTSEYIPINNETSIQLDNLALREEEDLSITASLDNSDEEKGSVVTVEVKYNWLGGTANGNLIVTLFDADGEPLERQQLYDSENPGNLLDLSKEGSAEKVFTFDEKGAYVEVAFTDLVLDEANAELFSVTLTGATVTYDPEKRTYFATGANLTSGILNILPRDPEAEILLDDEKYDVNDPKSIALSYGITEWIIKVTSQAGDDPLDETAYEEYKLVLDNKLVTASSGGGGGGGSGAGAGYTVSVTENTGNGTVTVKPDQARYGQTVTITAQPDKGYQVGSVIVTDANGGKVTVTSKGDGTYTFIMPDSKVTVEVTFVPEGQWVNPFIDVAEDAWYYDGVKYVHQNGLMAGTSANTFEPETDTTRAMLVTILYRLEGSPSMEDEIWGYPYADVEAQSWYGTAVYWARLHGIVKGYNDELFGPGDVITREQMAVILYRYAQYKGYDVSARGDLGKYTDGDQTSSWALEAVRWANAAGLINGTDNAALLPQGSATRAQAAAILTRFCQTSEK